MTVKLINRGTEGELLLEGRLDAVTSPEAEELFLQMVERFEKLTLNMEQLQYISSAGLRILLATQKTMNKQGQMIIKNVNETIYEIFEVTGFVDILTIE